MSSNGTLLQSALSYAARGWPVFPLHNPIGEGQCSCGRPSDPPNKSDRAEGVEYCSSPAKHPRTKFGLKDATTDEQQIREWWHRWPNANIGLPTGAVSFVVIDIDPRHGGDESWQGLVCQFGGIEKVANARTGSGGEHLLFAHPGVKVKNNQSGKLGEGVDVRGDGGYIVAAPSRHVSGGEYAWLTPPNGTLPDLPDWLREMMAREPELRPISSGPVSVPEISDNYARKALTEEAAAVATAIEGRRNQQLNDSAYSLGQLVAAGVLYRGDVEQALEAAALQAGLGETETRLTLRSGLNAGMREPRQIPEKKTPAAVATRPRVPDAGPDEVAEFINQLEQEADPERARSPQFWRQTHEGMARELLNRYGENIRYIHDLSKDLTPDNFAAWNGQLWEFRAKAVGVIAEFQRKMTSEFREFVKQQIGEYEDDPDALDKRQKALVMFGKTIESSGFKAGWKQELKGFVEMHVAMSAFDADPFALNCLNGTLDLRSGKLRPHRREDLLTKSTNLNYNPDAQCPEWLKFLAGVFRDDEELIAYVRRAIGYSLTGDTREQCLFLCHGHGSNGKSTLLNAIAHVMGDYARAAVVKTFMSKTQDAAISNDLAMLAGRRFVTAVETNEGQRLDEALVKQASGGDKISARFMFSEFFEFVPSFKLWFGMNHEPEVRGTDEGIWRRLKKIPFLARFEGEQKDESLPAKLKAEAEGILAWAVEGCVEWEQDGLREPSIVSAAVKEYREEQDVLGHFLDRCCEIDAGYIVKTSELYAEYARDAERNGVKFPLSSNSFGRKLTDRGFLASRDVDSDRARRGLRLKPRPRFSEEPPY